jgi:hypothetical protein
MTHLTLVARHVDRCKELEPRVVEISVLFGRTCTSFHVRLPEAEEDVEVLIGFLCLYHQWQAEKQEEDPPTPFRGSKEGTDRLEKGFEHRNIIK